MKKLLQWGLLFLFFFSFTACDTTATGLGLYDDSQVDYAENIRTMLETDEGYVFDARDESSIEYYSTNSVYGLSVTVIELYLGYVNQTERWMELIVFSTSTQAQMYYDEAVANGPTGQLVYLENDCVVITYSQDTIDALNGV